MFVCSSFATCAVCTGVYLCGLLQLEEEVARLESNVTRVQHELEETRGKLLKTEKVRHTELTILHLLLSFVVAPVYIFTVTQ